MAPRLAVVELSFDVWISAWTRPIPSFLFISPPPPKFLKWFATCRYTSTAERFLVSCVTYASPCLVARLPHLWVHGLHAIVCLQARGSHVAVGSCHIKSGHLMVLFPVNIITKDAVVFVVNSWKWPFVFLTFTIYTRLFLLTKYTGLLLNRCCQTCEAVFVLYMWMLAKNKKTKHFCPVFHPEPGWVVETRLVLLWLMVGEGSFLPSSSFFF